MSNFVKVLSRFSRCYTWTDGRICRYSSTISKRHSSTYYHCDPPQLLRLVIYYRVTEDRKEPKCLWYYMYSYKGFRIIIVADSNSKDNKKMNVLIFNRNTGYKQGTFENSAPVTLGSLNSVFFFFQCIFFLPSRRIS